MASVLFRINLRWHKEIGIVCCWEKVVDMYCCVAKQEHIFARMSSESETNANTICAKGGGAYADGGAREGTSDDGGTSASESSSENAVYGEDDIAQGEGDTAHEEDDTAEDWQPWVLRPSPRLGLKQGRKYRYTRRRNACKDPANYAEHRARRNRLRRLYHCRVALRLIWCLSFMGRREAFLQASFAAIQAAADPTAHHNWDEALSPLLGFLADAIFTFRAFVSTMLPLHHCAPSPYLGAGVFLVDFYEELGQLYSFVCSLCDTQQHAIQQNESTVVIGAHRMFSVFVRYLLIYHHITDEDIHRHKLLALLHFYPPCQVVLFRESCNHPNHPNPQTDEYESVRERWFQIDNDTEHTLSKNARVEKV